MREAIGGTWLIYFFFIFVIIYVSFIAFVMNYASAYRTNNYIVSFIENNEGNINISEISDDVKNKYGYIGKIDCSCDKSGSSTIYKVTTYVSFDLPFLGQVSLPGISTDSKTVYGGKCENNVCE